MTNADIKTQFAESYYNERDEREGVTIRCLDTAALNGAYTATQTGAAKSGYYGET